MTNGDHKLTSVMKQLFDRGTISSEFREYDLSTPMPQTRMYLLGIEQNYREHLGLELPTFRPDDALWSAKIFYQFARFYTYAELKNLDVSEFRPPESEPVEPETIYSVDIVLRFLPDLIQLFNSTEADQNTMRLMSELARIWPLSSVGCQEIESVDSQHVLNHPGLRIMYLDRIIARNDQTRMKDKLVKQALHAYQLPRPTESTHI